jgi:hypothetical protein
MTKEEALAKIKALRDAINDGPDPAGDGWTNQVLFWLDRASDVIEFPDKDYPEVTTSAHP